MNFEPVKERSRPAGSALLPLQSEGLTLEVDGARLVNNITVRLSTPGVTIIMGANGAGKSLLIHLLHGLRLPTSGSVTWGGKPMSESIRRRQAMVFQRPVLLRRSVAANIDFVLGLRKSKADGRRDRALEMVGLLDRARQPARLLSGGEQQRLALARALALEPEVLFLDEPTANLDPASVARIEQVVQTVRGKGTKVIFITHDISQARRLADEVVFVHRGDIVEQAPAIEFFSKPRSGIATDYLEGRIVL